MVVFVFLVFPVFKKKCHLLIQKFSLLLVHEFLKYLKRLPSAAMVWGILSRGIILSEEMCYLLPKFHTIQPQFEDINLNGEKKSQIPVHKGAKCRCTAGAYGDASEMLAFSVHLPGDAM